MTLTPYINDLLAQPSALLDTLTGLSEQPRLDEVRSGLSGGVFQRIVLTGMGSSHFALIPLQLALARAGLAPLLVETSELLGALSPLLDQRALVIAASQSGRSAEIVELVKRKDAQGFALAAITNTPGSPLDDGANWRLLTRAGEEATVSCKTYAATLLAAQWLGDLLLGIEPDHPSMTQAALGVEAYLAGWQEHVEALAGRLDGIRDVFFTGRGVSLASVLTGGLILKEAAHVHAEGLTAAAFRHGPLEMVSNETFVLVFEGEGAGAPLNRRLLDDAIAAGGRGALVSPWGEGPFQIPAVPPAMLPVVEILPAQMMTLALSSLKGHEAGRFERASKVTTQL